MLQRTSIHRTNLRPVDSGNSRVLRNSTESTIVYINTAARRVYSALGVDREK